MRWMVSCLVFVLGIATAVGGATVPCVGGTAAGFPCANVELVARLTEAQLGTQAVSDNWGWTDPTTGIEYALLVSHEGTIFVSLEDPENPLLLGKLAAHNNLETFIRDIKVYQDHAFIVADVGGHGMQIFDLTQLRSVPSPPATFTETAHYAGIGEAHNLALDPVSGLAYPVATDTCGGGLHIADLSTPTSPVFQGCYSEEGTFHDAHCFVYQGPDVEHQGKSICIGADLAGAEVTIVDISDPTLPVRLSSMAYGGVISHQGWATEDHRYYLHADEGDESSFGHGTKTYIWDIQDLEAPFIAGEHEAASSAIDHNLYVRGNFVFEANYDAGLRVLELTDLASGILDEVAFLDTRPTSDGGGFGGAWSNYPFFPSGLVIVTDTQQGLFVIRPLLGNDIFSDGFETGDTSAWDVVMR